MLLSYSIQKLTDRNVVSFSKFLIKSFIWQLALIVFVLALVFLYLHFDWKKQASVDVENIKAFTEHNFSRYQQMIDMMQAKIQSEKADTKEALNTAKYNKFLSCGKIYVDVSGNYLVDYNDSEPQVISEFGAEIFTLLPSKEFFDSFATQGESKFYLDKDIIFLAKSIGTKFIVLKIDAKDFVSQIVSKTILKGDISFYLKNNKEAIAPMFNLELVYKPTGFARFLGDHSNILSLILVASLLSSILWALMIDRFNNKELKPSFMADQKDISMLNKKLEQSQRYATGLENSLVILSTFVNSYFKQVEFEAKISKANISEIINDSKAILFKELSESNIVFELSVSCDKAVDLTTAKALYLLLINYLLRAIHRTHKNGSIYIKLSKTQGLVNIQIQD